jgi:hypothetical protein
MFGPQRVLVRSVESIRNRGFNHDSGGTGEGFQFQPLGWDLKISKGNLACKNLQGAVRSAASSGKVGKIRNLPIPAVGTSRSFWTVRKRRGVAICQLPIASVHVGS